MTKARWALGILVAYPYWKPADIDVCQVYAAHRVDDEELVRRLPFRPQSSMAAGMGFGIFFFPKKPP